VVPPQPCDAHCHSGGCCMQVREQRWGQWAALSGCSCCWGELVVGAAAGPMSGWLWCKCVRGSKGWALKCCREVARPHDIKWPRIHVVQSAMRRLAPHDFRTKRPEIMWSADCTGTAQLPAAAGAS
jgi:hypothetical protein